MENTQYTICACSSRTFIPKSRIVELVARMRCQGLVVRLVADLCRLVERDDESLSAIAASTVIACYPRAIEALFASRGLTPVRVMDMRSFEWPADRGRARRVVSGDRSESVRRLWPVPRLLPFWGLCPRGGAGAGRRARSLQE